MRQRFVGYGIVGCRIGNGWKGNSRPWGCVKGGGGEGKLMGLSSADSWHVLIFVFPL